MGMEIDGPTCVFRDNQLVLCNTVNPESTLKQKSNMIAYHYMREAVAKGEMVMAYIPSEYKLLDIMTKVLPGGEKRDYQGFLRDLLLSKLLFVSFLKIACLHVSFTAYENFYKPSKMHCLLVLFSSFFPSEV